MKCLNILGFQIMAAGGNFVTLWLKSLGLKKLGSYGETTELSQPLIPVGLLFIFVGTLTWLRLIYAIVYLPYHSSLYDKSPSSYYWKRVESQFLS